MVSLTEEWNGGATDWDRRNECWQWHDALVLTAGG